MKACIEMDALIHDLPGSSLSQACADAVRELLAGGGKGNWRQVESRFTYCYEFDGPHELVRPVVTAYMTLILAHERQHATGDVSQG